VHDDEIGAIVIECAIRVHRALGPGLLESAYEACLAHELQKSGLVTRRQLALPLEYDGLIIEVGYRVDLLVNERVVLEVKAIDRFADVHKAQLLSYLRLGGFRVGYLLNFNVALMKSGILRMVNGYEKQPGAPS
jgi:GxxExxY protein